MEEEGSRGHQVPQKYDLDAKWDACIDLSLRRVVYSTLAGAFGGLVLFRTPVTRWASVALGAGVGIGSSYTACSYLLDSSLPKVTDAQAELQTMGSSQQFKIPLLPETNHNQKHQQGCKEEQKGDSSSHERYLANLLAMSFAFLTYNSITAGYQVRNNIPALSLIVVTYINFVLLFWVGRELQRTSCYEAQKRGRLKKAAWVVASSLDVVVSYQVAVCLPFAFHGLVYLVAATFIIASFLLCFLCGDDSEEDGVKDDEIDGV